jgi:hypothetical protein
MNIKRFINKKAAIVALAAAVVVGGGGAAFAYFLATGSGTGGAQTAGTPKLTIAQIGAGYDSLIPTNNYVEDQCMEGCTGPSEIGQDVTLANAGPSPSTNYQQLVNVVVAVRNWGGPIANLPISLYLSQTADGATTIPVNVASIPGADGPNPTTTNVTLDVSADDLFVPSEFQYGISFPQTGAYADADSLNIALSSSADNLVVGSDTSGAGSLWIDDSNGPNNDFPTCDNGDFPTHGFVLISTDCGAAQELGAYGTDAQVAAGNGDIPAVEFNVVGGIAPALSPGSPADPISYAVTNPTSSTAYLTTVKTAISGVGNSVGGCEQSWYSLTGATATADQDIAAGQTVFYQNTGTEISMPANDITDQSACEGQTVTLSFTSP